MKKTLTIFLMLVLVLSMAVSVGAKGPVNNKAPIQNDTDGRHGNGVGTGVITADILEAGPYYVGDTITVVGSLVEIDGPLDTLNWSGTGSITLSAAMLGSTSFEVKAWTTFKNGVKAGQIHSTASAHTQAITVVERPVVEATAVPVNIIDISISFEPQGPQQYKIVANYTIVYSNGNTVVVTGDASYGNINKSVNANNPTTKVITITAGDVSVNYTVVAPQ